MTHIVSDRCHDAAEALLLQAVDVIQRYTSPEQGLSRDRAFDELMSILDSPAATEVCETLKSTTRHQRPHRPRSWHRHFAG
jgi:hypothetical protein